jgi:hypothetical protein
VDRNSRPASTICAGSLYRGVYPGRESVMPESVEFPIFLRATMPQVQSPDSGGG